MDQSGSFIDCLLGSQGFLVSEYRNITLNVAMFLGILSADVREFEGLVELTISFTNDIMSFSLKRDFSIELASLDMGLDQ